VVFGRQRTGSVICTSCGVLVGVNDAACYNCGRRNPGLWGFGPWLRSLGNDLGFVPFVIGTCVVLYVLTIALIGRAQPGLLGRHPWKCFVSSAIVTTLFASHPLRTEVVAARIVPARRRAQVTRVLDSAIEVLSGHA